ncbi:unnamed protein product [Amaranthus hypochondriacus]
MDSYPPPPGFSELNLKRVLIVHSMMMKILDNQLKSKKTNVVQLLVRGVIGQNGGITTQLMNWIQQLLIHGGKIKQKGIPFFKRWPKMCLLYLFLPLLPNLLSVLVVVFLMIFEHH